MVETMNIQLGKSTSVSLKSLSTAGYTWQFETGTAGIIVVEKTENSKDFRNMPVGASLDEIFTITGIGLGSSALVFHQSRSWETNVKPVEIKTYQVLVYG